MQLLGPLKGKSTVETDSCTRVKLSDRRKARREEVTLLAVNLHVGTDLVELSSITVELGLVQSDVIASFAQIVLVGLLRRARMAGALGLSYRTPIV